MKKFPYTNPLTLLQTLIVRNPRLKFISVFALLSLFCLCSFVSAEQYEDCLDAGWSEIQCQAWGEYFWQCENQSIIWCPFFEGVKSNLDYVLLVVFILLALLIGVGIALKFVFKQIKRY